MKESGSAKVRLTSGHAFGVEITIECVDGCVQNEVAVRAGFQVAPDLDLNGRGEPPL